MYADDEGPNSSQDDKEEEEYGENLLQDRECSLLAPVCVECKLSGSGQNRSDDASKKEERVRPISSAEKRDC